MTHPLIIGLPSKGRLQENAFAFFARAGLNVSQARGARDYRGAISGLEGVEIAFLSASEIVTELARGAIHFGLTGADLVEEALPDPAAKVEMLVPLGFGFANVVVAVPQAWIDVHAMADIEDVAAAFRQDKGRRLRVATKYVNLTRRFFKRHGIADYRIVESLGATEGAPAAGTADCIVDITTTGSTLAANALKVLDDGTMLKSEAWLIASRVADWNAAQREAARQVLARIHAETEASNRRELRAFLDGSLPETLAREIDQFGGEILLDGSAGIVSLLVPKADVPRLADKLVAAGARRVLVASPDYAFSPDNPLFDRLTAALPTQAGQDAA
ncbi:MAG: ATP phosphoribosyltransferase [Methylobacterium sp.]|nr:MAG: ATP phosphoribosyltransferase [Methylobacterium sp.]